MSLCMRSVPWASLFALIVSVVGCLSFALLIDAALEGFSMQVNTLVPVGSLAARWVIVLTTVLFIISAIVFVVIGAASTAASTRHQYKSDSLGEDRSFICRAVTSRCMLASFSIASMAFVLLWSLVVCASAVCAVLYFIFIGGVYSFCALVDQQCFDFTVLLPALINRLSDKKVDLTFCKEKKEALCAAKHNQVWPFIGAFLCSMIALAGLVYFLMCMTANYTRLRYERRAKKGDHYAMNQGTVDSNSFIMTNMGK